MNIPKQRWEHRSIQLVQQLDRVLRPLVGSQARVRVLGLLMLNPDRAFYVRELAYLANLRVHAVERQLRRLRALDLVTRRETNVKVFYRCNRASPLVSALQHLCHRAGQIDVHKT